MCLSVSLSVKSHIASGASVRPETAVTHSACNEGQIFSETASFQSYGTSYHAVRHFHSAEYACELAFIRAIPTASVAQAWQYAENDGAPTYYRLTQELIFLEHAHSASTSYYAA